MSDSDPRPRRLRFCTRCGAELGQRLADGRVRPACPSCGLVVYLDPKVACAVLVEREGRVLLVRRRFDPGRGLWCLPCGFEDADESPQQAARREAREETGLEVELGALLGAYHYTDDPRGAGVLLVFLARCDPLAAPQAGDDAEEAGFFSPADLPPISHHTHRAALEDWLGQRAGER